MELGKKTKKKFSRSMGREWIEGGITDKREWKELADTMEGTDRERRERSLG